MLGLGLIGGSVALALRDKGWHVSGDDQDPTRTARALDEGIVDAVGLDPASSITFVCVPVQAVADQAKRALAETQGVVTDVGSVKAGIAAAIDDPRFVGGHPMAGSELEGLDGADANAVLRCRVGPDADGVDHRRDVQHRRRRRRGHGCRGGGPRARPPRLRGRRREPRAAPDGRHAHGLARDRAEEHAALLRLAAGGFRDMTRIASGHPGIWLDICSENRTAILSALDELIDGLSQMRSVVADEDP